MWLKAAKRTELWKLRAWVILDNSAKLKFPWSFPLKFPPRLAVGRSVHLLYSGCWGFTRTLWAGLSQQREGSQPWCRTWPSPPSPAAGWGLALHLDGLPRLFLNTEPAVSTQPAQTPSPGVPLKLPFLPTQLIDPGRLQLHIWCHLSHFCSTSYLQVPFEQPQLQVVLQPWGRPSDEHGDSLWGNSPICQDLITFLP